MRALRRVWVRLAAIGCGALACNGAGSFVVPETNGGARGQLADPAEGHGSRELLPSGADSPVDPRLAPVGAGGASEDDERHSELDDGVGGGVGTGGSGAEEAAGAGGGGGAGFGGSGSADPASGEERRYALLR